MGWRWVKKFSISSEFNTVANIFSVADHWQVKPNIIWEAGVTYLIGTEDQAVSNQTIQVFKYVHSTNTFSWQQVGSGTDSPDAQNHNVSYLWRGTNNRWYTGQTNLHNNGIDLLKSDTDDVITTWTEQTQIGGKNSYPKFFLNPSDGFACVGVRLTTPDGLHDVGFRLSDSSSIEGTYTLYRLTNNSNEVNHWFYPQFPRYYGACTKQYIFGMIRQNTTNKFFGHALFRQNGNLNNWDNYDNSFNKDISVAAITNAEVETNYMVNGTNTTDSDDNGAINAISVADVLYWVGIKDGQPATDKYIWKLDGNTLTDTKINIPNLSRGNGSTEIFIYYNGENIVLSCATDDNGTLAHEIWAMSMDLTELEQRWRRVVSNWSFGLVKLPDNLDEITGEYAFPISNASGGLTLALTSDKFYI